MPDEAAVGSSTHSGTMVHHAPSISSIVDVFLLSEFVRCIQLPLCAFESRKRTGAERKEEEKMFIQFSNIIESI